MSPQAIVFGHPSWTIQLAACPSYDLPSPDRWTRVIQLPIPIMHLPVILLVALAALFANAQSSPVRIRGMYCALLIYHYNNFSAR